MRLYPGKSALAQRSAVGNIIGCNDETKGYRVYLSKSNVVITTQHVKKIVAISADQNKRLLRGVSDPVASGDREVTPASAHHLDKLNKQLITAVRSHGRRQRRSHDNGSRT